MSTDQKRVKFNFDIRFSNGGGLQGQDFRLDIDGDQIDDAALAGYIVRDLNLLMVGEVLPGFEVKVGDIWPKSLSMA
ncbi:MAG: hypothetical protein IAE89_16520 [Anaerolineae bacterium]|nr:hypothetical protein [Anaerolineae bacterium]